MEVTVLKPEQPRSMLLQSKTLALLKTQEPLIRIESLSPVQKTPEHPVRFIKHLALLKISENR